MTANPKKFYTPEEYLELERKSSYKSEYYDGEIFPMGDFEGDTPEAMAGARSRHNAIKENAAFGLNVHVRKTGGCRVFTSDQRVHIPANGLYTYPDVVVICGKPHFTDSEFDTFTNPVLIVEVLSKRTASYDRGEKFGLYRSIPTLSEYLTLDSRKIAVELWRKTGATNWNLVCDTHEPEAVIPLESLNLTLFVADLYENLEDLPAVDFGFGR
ncbi:MAG: Uma2 family endonuclease [Cytophagaceae bacterium]|nr:Uma2 family endonuclease [Cytophagaceae bacterium]